MPRKILWVLAVLLFSCGRTDKKEAKHDTKELTAPFKIRYAENFTVRYFETYKEVTIKIASQGNNKTQRYALVPRGKKNPAGFASENVIEIPVRTCVLASQTHIACLQALGLDDKLVGLTEASYLPDSNLLARLRAKKIYEVGKDGVWQNELLFSLKPDLVMLSGMGDEAKLTLPAPTKKVVNTDWQESHPLGRLEWLYFISLFFEAEEKALKFCENKINGYNSKIEALKMAQKKPKKVIFDVPYKGVWYMPAGKSYMATLLKDAGGEYAWQDTKGSASLPLDFETVYAEAKKADVWLNVGICRKIADITAIDSRLADIPALRAGKVFSYQKQTWANGANPYFLKGILEPDALLHDFIQILHPHPKVFHKHYYEQLK
jgi:iron complex transport system substrate-binding protein